MTDKSTKTRTSKASGRTPCSTIDDIDPSLYNGLYFSYLLCRNCGSVALLCRYNRSFAKKNKPHVNAADFLFPDGMSPVKFERAVCECCGQPVIFSTDLMVDIGGETT